MKHGGWPADRESFLSAPAAGRAQVHAAPGSSLHQVWQALRASSAAPYYLDDFKCGADRCAPRPPRQLPQEAAPTPHCLLCLSCASETQVSLQNRKASWYHKIPDRQKFQSIWRGCQPLASSQAAGQGWIPCF